VSREFQSRVMQDLCLAKCGVNLRRAIKRGEKAARRERKRRDEKKKQRHNKDDSTKSGKESDVEDFSEDTEVSLLMLFDAAAACACAVGK
jgi:septal ring factor EnvC (AmiA/AmiB activator)